MAARKQTSPEEAEALSYWPGLKLGPWQKTSEATEKYNCVAHAVRDPTRWWWPGGSPTPAPGDEYWPADAPASDQVESFVYVFEQLGFRVCPTGDHEPGVEKVAIYVDASGLVQHVARQLPSGLWTSKLGHLMDISHRLEALEGQEYGRATHFLGRPRARRVVTKTQP